MTDDDIVKLVSDELFPGVEYENTNERLGYYTTQLSPFEEQAARVHFNILVFQEWKRHLHNALITVENWRAE